VSITLPRELGVRLNRTGTTCTPEQLTADACPAGAQIGTARAVTPILDRPLAGPVFLVARRGRLPLVAALLRSDGITVELDGATAVSGGRVRTTFGSVPDVPLSVFDLHLPGGRGSILGGAKVPCSGAALAATLVGQNAARRSQRVPLRVACPPRRRAELSRDVEGSSSRPGT
jgi:hypothetical protein